MAINAKKQGPRLATIFGGLSGPAIKPVALRLVYQVAQALPDIPILGIGGVCTGEDAIEFMLAGSCLVQVGTANFMRPDAANQVALQLETFCQEQQIFQIRDLIGCFRPKISG